MAGTHTSILFPGHSDISNKHNKITNKIIAVNVKINAILKKLNFCIYYTSHLFSGGLHIITKIARSNFYSPHLFLNRPFRIYFSCIYFYVCSVLGNGGVMMS